MNKGKKHKSTIKPNSQNKEEQAETQSDPNSEFNIKKNARQSD
ncbi:MAG: hypothetical protein ACYDG2_11190 [Ruminiclostridium sp.]